MIPAPPKLSDLRVGTKLRAGLSGTTVIADFDFETYSPAGFVWDATANKWRPPAGASGKGLSTVGAVVYTEHPDAEVLSLAYDLKDGNGPTLWRPSDDIPDTALGPFDLFLHLHTGSLLEAWNVSFEYWVWTNICVPKYGFPPLPVAQLRCAMAKARAFALPGSLDAAGNVLNITNKKDARGKALIKRFCIPRDPTKTDDRLRIDPAEDSQGNDLYEYNKRDIEAEAEASSLTPDLSQDELEFWQCDQAINRRGVQIDLSSVDACIAVIEQAYAKYNAELFQLTDGAVGAASELQRLAKWAATEGYVFKSLTVSDVDEFLENSDHAIDYPKIYRALQIRSILGLASVKKLYSMRHQVSRSGRLHDLFIYHSARTGRTAGAGPQPQNLPKSGPDTIRCYLENKQRKYVGGCGRHYGEFITCCPWCGDSTYQTISEWGFPTVRDALETVTPGDLNLVEFFWGDAVATVSGCLRGLFISAPGHDLICSDYSAIEAVVLAALAGEQWRLDVFNTHGKIYEMSASKITGIPFEEYDLHKATTGQHHPTRGKIGKVAELAGGYQGGISAWKQFGADKFFDNDEAIKEAVNAWRRASPAIVNMWGGQRRNWKEEYYGLEGMAVLAVLNPGVEFEYRKIVYLVQQDILYSYHRDFGGSPLTYHKPRLNPGRESWHGHQLSFEGWNSNANMGAIGWTRMNTYGGKLTENWTQKIARYILAHALRNLERSGYPVVLHIHDEIVSEVPEGFGSIQEFESIMSQMPPGAQGWPIFAKGGWRDKRYRKE